MTTNYRLSRRALPPRPRQKPSSLVICPAGRRRGDRRRVDMQKQVPVKTIRANAFDDALKPSSKLNRPDRRLPSGVGRVCSVAYCRRHDYVISCGMVIGPAAADEAASHRPISIVQT